VTVKTADLTFGGLFPDSYLAVSGASIAAPHVAGAMVLLLSAFPDLTVDDLETVLKESAFDLGDSGPDNTMDMGFWTSSQPISCSSALSRRSSLISWRILLPMVLPK